MCVSKGYQVARQDEFLFVCVRCISLGHADRRKAEKARAQKERELRMGIVERHRLRLNKLLEDYLQQARIQIEVSTADSASLETDFGTHLAHAPQNAGDLEEEVIAAAMQTLVKAGVIKKQGNCRLFEPFTGARRTKRPTEADKTVKSFFNEKYRRYSG